MSKSKLSLSMLERIKYKNPQDIVSEQEIVCADDGSYRHYYKCPCGCGRVVDDKDATPGYHSHVSYIECAVCREVYELG